MSNILIVNSTDLSSDQRYLLDIWNAVKTGKCSLNLNRRSPGKLSHARWLTTTTRTLRRYIGTENPSFELLVLVKFIMRVYVPMWFQIKCHPTIKDASMNLWESIWMSRFLEDDLRDIVYNVIQSNGYFAHPENILFAMPCDQRASFNQINDERRFSKFQEVIE